MHLFLVRSCASTQLFGFFFNQKSRVVCAHAKPSAAPNTPRQGCDFATCRLSRRKVSGQDSEKSVEADKPKRTRREVKKPKLFLPLRVAGLLRSTTCKTPPVNPHAPPRRRELEPTSDAVATRAGLRHFDTTGPFIAGSTLGFALWR